MEAGIAFDQELNEEQYRAVMAPDGPVLVIAAAGTGKTRTLTYRVARLVEQGIDPWRILLLTFTNKAAREMTERATALVGERVGGMWGGTFHHMANRMLRQHASSIGYRLDYSILDQDDARRLVKMAVEEVKPVKSKLFPKPDLLLSLYGLASSREVPVETILRERFQKTEVEPEVENMARVHGLYQRRKRELNAMDFDDLLMNGLVLFRECPDLLDRYRERFLHVLVDEYQDTNTIQAEWVDKLASFHRNLLVVGDDFQSIYSWRGANFRNILDFQDRYPDATVFKLETNYRSVPEVLEVANACIAGNPEQHQKTLRPVREGSAKPMVVKLRDGDHQAEFIAERVRFYRREGYALKDMVVLYRSHFHTLELQFRLDHEGIPYVLTSGLRFFEQAHIKDATCLLRLHANPWDGLAFARLLQLFPKLGEKTVAKLWEGLDRRWNPKDAGHRAALLKAMPKGPMPLWAEVDKELGKLYGRTEEPSAGDLVEVFQNAYYAKYAAATFDNVERRMEDVEELIRFSSRFESIEAFLNEMALLTNMDAESDDPHAEPPDAIRLSTVHQAKGLEWKVVFIAWLADGMFPSQRSVGESGDDREERRLFYVAVTRAEDELVLCAPTMRRMRDGGSQFYNPSRFVKEIPPALVRSQHYYG
ncbi:MAG TPA: ATP-dependent helicase [Kiritimatiellia bacterium]|nr:ATP-dependent helicase [Kiritimatiellia bacterium]